MASYSSSYYNFIYLNPDGTWEESGFKAHWEALLFVEYNNYLIPAQWFSNN